MKTVINWDIPLLKEIIKKYLLIVVIITAVITAVGVAGQAYFHKPTFSTSAQMSQNDNNPAIISTYSQYIGTDHFKSLLTKEINRSKWKDEDKNYNVELIYDADSVFFSIRATSDNPAFSQFLSNQSMLIFTKDSGRYLSGVNVSLVSRAKVNRAPNPVKFIKSAIVVFLLSFIIVSVSAFLFEIYHGPIRNRRFIETAYNVRRLGDLDLEHRSK